MTRRTRDTIVSGLALLIVIGLTISPAGAQLRRAFAARETARVDGIAAAVQPRPNVVVPLDPSARLRRSTIRPGSGVRGQRGEPGPVGARGPKGTPGAAGPGDTRTFHSTSVYGPFPSGFESTVVTAQSVQPGTWLVQSTVKLRRPSGGEFLSACNITNGLQTWQGTTVAVGADAFGTGMQHATSVATAIVQNELPMDLAVRCSGSRFGGLGADLELYDPVLMVARLPAASSQLRGA